MGVMGLCAATLMTLLASVQPVVVIASDRTKAAVLRKVSPLRNSYRNASHRNGCQASGRQSHLSETPSCAGTKLGHVLEPSPGPRRLPRTLAALSDRPRTPGTRTTLRLAIARARHRGLNRR